MRITDAYSLHCHSCMTDIELRAGAPGQVQHTVCPRCGAALEMHWPAADEPAALTTGKFEGCKITDVPDFWLHRHLRAHRWSEREDVLDAIDRELYRRAALRRAQRRQAAAPRSGRHWFTLLDRMAGEEARG